MSNGKESRFRDKDYRGSVDQHPRGAEPKYSDRFARDRSPLNRRGERSPYQSGRSANSSPSADSASRREPTITRRLSNESVSRAQDRSRGGNGQSIYQQLYTTRLSRTTANPVPYQTIPLIKLSISSTAHIP